MAPQILPAKKGGVDQIGDGGVLEIDDPLGDQIGEVKHAAVGREVAGEGGMEERTLQLQVAGGVQGEEVAHVYCSEVVGPEAEVEHRTGKVLQIEPTQ